MDRFSIFVDAGYFFAAGAFAITAAKTPRRNINLVSAEAVIQGLCEQATKQSSIPNLLRVYWYDAITGPRLSMEQSTLAHLAGVKLRLGSLNNAGQQKGVDSLIVTDMIELARNRAISDAILVAGDEDLRIAVQVAQTFGVRVHVLAVGDATSNVSLALRMEADSLAVLDVSWLKKHMAVAESGGLPAPAKLPTASAGGSRAAPAVPLGGGGRVSPAASTIGKSLEDAARDVSNELLGAASHEALDGLADHLKTDTTIPPEFDRKLIAITAKQLGRELDSGEKRKIRGVFVKAVRERSTGS